MSQEKNFRRLKADIDEEQVKAELNVAEREAKMQKLHDDDDSKMEAKPE